MGQELPTDVRGHSTLDLESVRETSQLTKEVSQLNSERDLMWDELRALRPWYTVDQRRAETDPAVLQLLQQQQPCNAFVRSRKQILSGSSAITAWRVPSSPPQVVSM